MQKRMKNYILASYLVFWFVDSGFMGLQMIPYVLSLVYIAIIAVLCLIKRNKRYCP